MTPFRLSPEHVALLERHSQETLDLLMRLQGLQKPTAVPPQGTEALEREVSSRLAAGISGYVSLRVDFSPGKRTRAKLIEGEKVIMQLVDTRGQVA